jgi:hypothetical protein
MPGISPASLILAAAAKEPFLIRGPLFGQGLSGRAGPENKGLSRKALSVL